MTRILHLSDPHFGTELPDVVNALRQLMHELTPEVLVLSGDITQRARPRQFRAARAFLDSLAVPQTLVIPGNHDIALFNPFKRALVPYRDYRRILGAGLDPVIDEFDLLLIGVNTTRRYRHVNGEISGQQIRTVSDRLRAATRSQLRIVVTHQPAWVMRQQDLHDRLRGNVPALREWSKAGVDLILGGHIHLPYIAAVHEKLAGLERPLWVVQAGTAVSSRLRLEAGNSVNLIEHQPAASHCAVSQWDYQPATGRFASVRQTTLELHRR